MTTVQTRSVYWQPPVLRDEATVVALPSRLVDVLELLVQGLDNATIGARLYITEDTVKTHVKRLYARLGASNRAHAAALACTGDILITRTGAGDAQ